MMKKLLFAAACVAGAIAGAGVANAEEVRVVDANGTPVTFQTQDACLADGPHIALSNPEEDAQYPYFLCREGEDGLWYLFNSDTQ
ncbi:hypothetical protein MPRF_32050 [Mycolicibacterium parafortuitum]|uniref:Secreted protein n=2 Tax=Mycolicibacterium parafortuitum TaxID=39692 RepID=A0A7I7U7G9_MYCPF|nr:hypothetical protein MPRF_32050 [Mycolicibacterium parafortuitum]